MENAQEKEFRELVVSLSENVTDTETNKLVYTHCLPKEFKDKQPLVVLELMHDRDLFSSSKPEKLANILKDIKRINLAKMVEKYAKKARRKTGQKSRSTSTEADSSVLQAKLEVSHIQSNITAQVLDQCMAMAKVTPLQHVPTADLKNLTDDLQRLLQKARQLHDQLLTATQQASECPAQEQAWSDDGSVDSDIYTLPGETYEDTEPVGVGGPDYTYIAPEDSQKKMSGAGIAGVKGGRARVPPPDEESTSNEYTYITREDSLKKTGAGTSGAFTQPNNVVEAASRAEYTYMCKVPEDSQRNSVTGGSARADQMVTGVPVRGAKLDKPATRPKPTKTRTVAGTAGGPRVSPPRPTPQAPVIDASDIQKKMSTLRKAGSTTKSSDHQLATSKRYSVSRDGTGDSTGDSGFAEASTLLRVELGDSKRAAARKLPGPPPAEKPAYYKSLGSPDSADECYVEATRGNCNLQPEVYEQPVKQDEVTYMNVTKYSSR